MLIVEEGKHFHSSDDRHGSLHVIRSAAKRIIDNSDTLIRFEEDCPS